MDGFKAAFGFLVQGAMKEIKTTAGRFNLVVVVLLIVGSFGADSVHSVSSAIESIFGSDSSDFPLVAVLIIISVVAMFCMTLLMVGEIVREAAGPSSRPRKKKKRNLASV